MKKEKRKSKEIDGIRCYSPEVAEQNEDYPSGHFGKLFALEEKHFWYRARSRLIGQMIQQFLGDRLRAGRAASTKHDLRFLEVGCSTGFVLDTLKKKFPSFHFIGSELHIDALRYAKQRTPEAEFVQLDFRTTPFEDEFEGVGAFDVLEHVTEDELLMKSAYESLKSGGYFFLTVPQHRWLWSSQDDAAFHKRRYTRSEMVTKLRRAGFEIAFVSSFVFTLLPVMFLSRLRRKRKQKSIAGLEYSYDELNIPRWMNSILEWGMKIDEVLIRLGLSLPVGGSLLVVAKKKRKSLHRFSYFVIEN